MWDFGLSHNLYGFSRSPVNTNPASYVTRHAKAFGFEFSAPGCAEHYSVMQVGSAYIGRWLLLRLA
jgi:hypothetical protein